MDFDMPIKDGIETTKEIRKLEKDLKLLNVKIIG
jgi:hypothetical protein